MCPAMALAKEWVKSASKRLDSRLLPRQMSNRNESVRLERAQRLDAPDQPCRLCRRDDGRGRAPSRRRPAVGGFAGGRDGRPAADRAEIDGTARRGGPAQLGARHRRRLPPRPAGAGGEPRRHRRGGRGADRDDQLHRGLAPSLRDRGQLPGQAASPRGQLRGARRAPGRQPRQPVGSEMMADMENPGVRNREAQEAADRASTYEWGFSSDIEQDFAPKGLSEDTIRFISAKKQEPEWMLEWRLKAYRAWLTMEEVSWAKLDIPEIDFQDAYYYAEPKAKEKLGSLDEVDPEILRVYEKLGIPIEEQKVLAGVEGARKVAVDAVFDSVSVATTFREELKKAGVIFLSISEAAREHPELVRKYLGSVVPQRDNYFACLNSAVFSDGTFVYVPEGVRCPMELSTYFRINAANTGQFERTLIVADKGSYVSYLEGCTAPMRDENQLHAAVVELYAHDDSEIKYSTVQNWYPGDAEGRGGIYNFVTKRAMCAGVRSKVSWTQVETGSAITWKYPSCILKGEGSVGEFYSVAVTNNLQQADTGTKMIHIGANSRSTIVSKGISAGRSNNTYRGLVRVLPKADGVRNFTQCDSLLLGSDCGAHTVPYIEVKNPTATIEHEATTSKISEDQLFYAMQRGLDAESAVALIVNGFAREVLKQLPMEFAVEAQKLLGISLEGSVG